MTIMVNWDNQDTRFLREAVYSLAQRFLEADMERILSELDTAFPLVVVNYYEYCFS